MSIASQISRIQSAKTDIKTAIEAKGVTVPSNALIDTYPSYISAIPTGGGGDSDGIIDRSLSSITYSGSVVGRYAFAECRNLTTVNLPNATTLSNNAFASCKSLNNISMPNVTEIGSWTFQECGFSQIPNESNILNIGPGAFQACRNLTSINLTSCQYINSNTQGGATVGVFLSCSNLTDVNIPECLKIGNYTFASCYNLANISAPKLTNVSTSAFYNCSNLTTINLPSCTQIKEYAFGSCSNLSYVSIPKCETIAQRAFISCTSLQSISFGSSMSFIDVYAFSGCKSLSQVYIPSDIGRVITLSAITAFNVTPILDSSYLGYFGSIYVPSAWFSSYIIAKKWSDIASRLVSY